MKLILHIGQSKTGTTALQSFLFKNKKELLKQGIVYPDYYVGNTPLSTEDHNAFAEMLCDFLRHPNFSLETYLQQFHQQVRDVKCHTLLLSAESFFSAPHIWKLDSEKEFYDAYNKKLNILKSFTQEFQTHIIGYFHSPKDWLESLVPHTIRYTGLLEKNIYHSDEQLCSLLSPHLNYPKLLTLWEEIIQPQKMSIYPYERDALYKKDIIEDFCFKAGINISNIDKKKKSHSIHRSWDRRYIHLKKMLNKTKQNKVKERVIIQCLNQLNEKLPKIQKYQLDVELIKKIQVDFQPYYIWLNSKYGVDDKAFFSVKKSNDVEYESLTSEEMYMVEKDFQTLYKSWPIKWLYFKITCKSFLRNRLPYFYAILKLFLRKKGML